MADGQPEMIPMPERMPPDDRGPMPESFTRELSPEEEKNLLVNFMGSMYGETKKLDSNIVGESTTLERGRSEKIKRQIEQVISQPQQPVPQPVQAAPIPNPPVQGLTVPTQPVIQPEQRPAEDDSQLMFNFDTNEKEDLINNVNNLIKSVSNNAKLLKELNDKLDTVIDNITITSLPIKKAKKKSVEK